MKKYILLLSLLLFLSCRQKDIHEKFNTLKDLDYSEFADMRIWIRGGSYYVWYKELQLWVDYSFLTKKMHIEKAVAAGEDKTIVLPDEERERIRRAIIAYDKMKVLSVSMDEKENVFVAIPWYDYCTYYFLRLSTDNTLESINKQYYKHYEDNWYVKIRCSR